MNNTIYESCWLVSWKENGITRNQTYDWPGYARSIAADKRTDPDCSEVDVVELVPQGVKTLDMSDADFDEGYVLCDVGTWWTTPAISADCRCLQTRQDIVAPLAFWQWRLRKEG